MCARQWGYVLGCGGEAKLTANCERSPSDSCFLLRCTFWILRLPTPSVSWLCHIWRVILSNPRLIKLEFSPWQKYLYLFRHFIKLCWFPSHLVIRSSQARSLKQRRSEVWHSFLIYKCPHNSRESFEFFDKSICFRHCSFFWLWKNTCILMRSSVVRCT